MMFQDPYEPIFAFHAKVMFWGALNGAAPLGENSSGE